MNDNKEQRKNKKFLEEEKRQKNQEIKISK